MVGQLITNLQTAVECITNTRDFERLINDIFSRKYGIDYISPDYHKDLGLDGFITTEKMVVAKHCFEKFLSPKSNKSIEILKKARSDLKKVANLPKKMEIKGWIFITPYRIPSDVLIPLMQESKAVGLELKCLGPSFISGELYKNTDILKDHPYLHRLQIDENIQSIKKLLESTITKEQIGQAIKATGDNLTSRSENTVSDKQSGQIQSLFRQITESKKSDDLERILKVCREDPNPRTEREVKSIIYSSLDQEAVLQGVHTLVSWYKFSAETVDDQLGLIELGIDISKDLKSLDSEAVLLSEKGSLLSIKFVLKDLDGWSRIDVSNKVGIPLITDEQKAEIVSQLKDLNIEFNKLFKDAIEKAYASNNYLAVTKVLSRIGGAAGNRAGHFSSLGVNDRAIIERNICKMIFMHAKRVAAQYHDEMEIAYILHNYANALGFMGEKEEALLVFNESKTIATRHNMDDILIGSNKLLRSIKEPRIKLV